MQFKQQRNIGETFFFPKGLLRITFTISDDKNSEKYNHVAKKKKEITSE